MTDREQVVLELLIVAGNALERAAHCAAREVVVDGADDIARALTLQIERISDDVTRTQASLITRAY